MKNSVMVGLALGMIIGAVGVTFYKPAQNIVKKGTNAIKEEAEAMLNKVKNKD